MNPFTEFLNRVMPISFDDRATLEDLLVERSWGAEEVIHASGDVCKSIRFLKSGLAYSSFVNSAGREFIWNFYFNDQYSNFENHFVFDYHSFVSNTPSKLTFKTIGPVTTIELSYADAFALYTNSTFDHVGRAMSEQAYSNVHKRAFSLLTLSARDLYLQMLREEPHLLDKFPHFLVASYLGIAPQSLSRLRADITKNGFY